MQIKKRMTPVRDGTWRTDNGKVIGDDSYGYNSRNRYQQNVKFFYYLSLDNGKNIMLQ